MKTFLRSAQNYCNGRFSIPSVIADEEELYQGSVVWLRIESPQGSLRFDTKLKSGREIYGGLGEHIRKGDPIKVTILKSHPKRRFTHR